MEENSTDGKIISREIEQEMRTCYLDYAMSVIVSRALPDVRDGLKPVHKRILYAMQQMGMLHNKPFKKSARIVGEVLGKYHPHGDSAVYDSMVRMAQEFSLRYMLVDGQGNFGSVDGDSAAAMRYTEARLKKLAEELLVDIEKETVDFRPNFDASLKEPVVLPAKFPNLLVNGSSGIAVGMATNIPPHNMNEVVDGCISYINNPEITDNEMMEIVKGPDFPTQGIIVGSTGIKLAYKTGRGKIKVRSRTNFEDHKNRRRIIVTEIPYMVNKAMLVEEIARLVKDDIVLGISDLRDESSKAGTRIVVELKKDADEEIVLNQLLKHSRMQVTFGINMLALVDNVPKTLSLRGMITHFVKHRQDVVRRRTQFDLKKAKEKAHILEGLKIALDNIDAVIELIKKAESGEVAKKGLIENYDLTDKQAQAILEMRLQRLTGLEQEKIKSDLEELKKLIVELESILADEMKILGIIKGELVYIKEKYGDGRRTQIIEADEEDMDIEDLIEEDTMIVTKTYKGYIKRMPVSTYKQQRRGGKGIIAAKMDDDDFVDEVFVASTHAFVLFFSDKGKVYWQKVYNIPEGSRQARGKAIVNLLDLDKDEKISAVIPVREFNHGHYLVMATKKGVAKKTDLKAFSRPRKGGIIAIKLDEGDELIDVRMTDGDSTIFLATRNGKAIRFSERHLRAIGRASRGVRGIMLKGKDEVIGMVIGGEGKTLLTITENGYGKRTDTEDYRLINRGGMGVINIICSERNGGVVAVRSVTLDDDVMFMSKNGIVIRTPVKGISVIGRNTQGMRLMKVSGSDRVVACARVPKEEEAEEEVEEEEKAPKPAPVAPTPAGPKQPEENGEELEVGGDFGTDADGGNEE